MTPKARGILLLTAALAVAGGTVLFQSTHSRGTQGPATSEGSAAAAPERAGKVPEGAIIKTSTSPAPKTPTADASEPAKSVSFDDVKLELKKGEPYDSSFLTPKVKQIDGKAIRIRGYILPSFQQTGIKQFVLVRDNQECCFGPGALLHDCILVEMGPGAAATFVTRPVSVEGVFTVHELKGPDGKHLAIYHLDGKSVE